MRPESSGTEEFVTATVYRNFIWRVELFLVTLNAADDELKDANK